MDDDRFAGSPSVTRRWVVGLAIGVPTLLAMSAASAAAEDKAVCVDLDTLPASQQSMRRSLGFKLQTSDPKKRCGLCTFFASVPAGTCGKCQLLSGGAVTPNSVCDSFAAKA